MAGGIDDNEDPGAAALREVAEETSIVSASILSEREGWLQYDFPTVVRTWPLAGPHSGPCSDGCSVCLAVALVGPAHGAHVPTDAHTCSDEPDGARAGEAAPGWGLAALQGAEAEVVPRALSWLR